MDKSVLVALIGMGGIAITSFSVVVVAIINSRKERGDTAESAVEKTLRERLTLRDEQLADLREDKNELLEKVANLTETVADQGLRIAQQAEIIETHQHTAEAGNTP